MCIDQSEETAALVDLVESGASLLRTVNNLLEDLQTLSAVNSKCYIYVTFRCLFCTCSITTCTFQCKLLLYTVGNFRGVSWSVTYSPQAWG